MKSEKQVFDDLLYLINRYARDSEKREEFLRYIDTIYPPPVRGIFSEMEKAGVQFSCEDKELVHDVFFFWG